jgi:hypothetical protein
MEKRGLELKLTNYVHKGIVHRENISKEKKYESKNFKHEYTFSPYTCIFILILFFVVYPLTEKPTNLHPKRPFTTKVEINKKFKRENILEHEPIRIFY